MKSLWSDREAKEFRGDLGLRVYTSRLLGRDKSLVLHGGGNTSVKIQEKNLFGEQETILYVKGSGWDLETIEPQGFSPVLSRTCCGWRNCPSLSDPEMVNQLVTHMLKAAARRLPSRPSSTVSCRRSSWIIPTPTPYSR